MLRISPLLARNSDHLAVRLDQSARSRRREIGRRYLLGAFHKVRARRRRVTVHLNVECRISAGVDIVQMQRCEPFVDDCVRGSRGILDRVIGMHQLLHFARASVILVQTGDTIVAVGDEVHLVADPHWTPVLRVFARHLHDRGIRELRHPHSRCISSAVPLPGNTVQPPFISEGHVGKMTSIRRVGAGLCHRQRHFSRQSSGNGNGEQTVEARIAVPARAEQDTLAIWRPANDVVDRWMVSKPHGDAALRRHHVNVRVAFKVETEGKPFIVGRERWAGLHARTAGQKMRRTTLPGDTPQLVTIGEDDLRSGDSRRMQQACCFGKMLRQREGPRTTG